MGPVDTLPPPKKNLTTQKYIGKRTKISATLYLKSKFKFNSYVRCKLKRGEINRKRLSLSQGNYRKIKSKTFTAPTPSPPLHAARGK
jgi:hypothetical protein